MTDDTAIELWRLLTQYKQDVMADDVEVGTYTVDDVLNDIEESLPNDLIKWLI